MQYYWFLVFDSDGIVMIRLPVCAENPRKAIEIATQWKEQHGGEWVIPDWSESMIPSETEKQYQDRWARVQAKEKVDAGW